jgi:hypothetical protein
VSDATVARINRWLMVAIVAVLLMAVALELLAPTLIQVVGGMLQGPQQMAPLCGSASGACP